MKKFLASFFVILFAISATAQFQLKGVVKDSLANEPIPYASIYIKGTNEGVIAGVNGQFTLFSSIKTPVVNIQCLGYKSKEIKLKGDAGNVIVYMQSASKSLDEIVVRRHREKYVKKGNPAVAFVEKVREHMHDRDPLNHQHYSYEKYEHMTYGLNDLQHVDKNLIIKTFKGAAEYLDTSEVTGKVILPMSLNETGSVEYFQRQPSKHKQLIVARQHVGLDEAFDAAGIKKFMDDAFREVDIFSNDVKFMQNRFISPLSNIGTSFYKYYLNDTIEVDGEKCVELDFLPFNNESFGFVGRMYFPVGDTTMFLKKCVMNVPKAINLNYVEHIYIEQEWVKSPNGSRLKTKDDLTIEFKVVSGTQGFYARRNTHYRNHSFASPVDMTIFDRDGEVIVAPDAEKHDKDYWVALRPSTAKQNEGSMREMMRRLRGSKLFYWCEQAFIMLYNGYVATGKPSKFDFGPLNTFMSGNPLEGLRMRIGGMTTAHLSKHWFGRGYVAYGFKDRKLKYYGGLEYSFNEKKYHGNEFPVHSLKLSHRYDVDKIGQHYMHTNQDNAFLLLKRKADNKINYLRQTHFGYKLELANGFSIVAGVEHNIHEASRALPFVNGEGTAFNRYATAGFNVTLRYAPGEKFYQTRSYRFPINIDNPIITLTHTCLPKDFLGGDFDVNKTELGIMKRFWFSAWGYTDIILKGAKVWSTVAYPDLLIPNANLSYTIQPESYALMNAMEFATDQNLSWDITYWANGAIMNYLPLVKKLKLREVISFRGFYGSLTSKNNPNVNSVLYQFPPDADCRPMGKKPYMEMGIGLDNIFKFLRVDYVWRLTYRNKSGVDKSGIRLQLHVAF